MRIIKICLILILSQCTSSCGNGTNDSLDKKIFNSIKNTRPIDTTFTSYKDLIGSHYIYQIERTSNFVFMSHKVSHIEYDYLIYSIKLDKIYVTKKITLPHGDIFTETGEECFSGFIEYLNDNSTSLISENKLFFEEYFSHFYNSKVIVLFGNDISIGGRAIVKEDAVSILFENTGDILIIEFFRKKKEIVGLIYFFDFNEDMINK